MPVPAPSPVKGNVDLPGSFLQYSLHPRLVFLEVSNCQPPNSMPRDVGVRDLNSRVKIFEDVPEARVLGLLERLLTIDNPVDNKLLEVLSIKAFNQIVSQGLLLWVVSAEIEDICNRREHPLPSLGQRGYGALSRYIPMTVGLPQVMFSILCASGIVGLRVVAFLTDTGHTNPSSRLRRLDLNTVFPYPRRGIF